MCIRDREYTVADHFDTPDWNGDNQPDAEQWYSANGTGLGFNYDVGKDWLEVNVTESAENGGEIMALGFKAPEAGTYTLTVFTQNKWGCLLYTSRPGSIHFAGCCRVLRLGPSFCLQADPIKENEP